MNTTATLTKEAQLLSATAKDLRQQARRTQQQEAQERRIAALVEIRAQELSAVQVADLRQELKAKDAQIAFLRQQENEILDKLLERQRLGKQALSTAGSVIKRLKTLNKTKNQALAETKKKIAKLEAEIKCLRDDQPTQPIAPPRPNDQATTATLRAQYRNLETQYHGAVRDSNSHKFEVVRCNKKLEALQQKLEMAHQQMDALCATNRELRAANEVLRRANELLSERVAR